MPKPGKGPVASSSTPGSTFPSQFGAEGVYNITQAASNSRRTEAGRVWPAKGWEEMAPSISRQKRPYQPQEVEGVMGDAFSEAEGKGAVGSSIIPGSLRRGRGATTPAHARGAEQAMPPGPTLDRGG